jgi:hypothetical protein
MALIKNANGFKNEPTQPYSKGFIETSFSLAIDGNRAFNNAKNTTSLEPRDKP